MRCRAQILAVLAIWASQASCPVAARGQAPMSLAGTGNELIEQFILDLDAQKYDARTAATRELVARGETAVPLLAAALRGTPSMELQTRGLEVLVRIARRTMADADASDLDGGAAEAALVALAERPEGAFSLRARQKLSVLRQDQQQAAVDQLAKLGGTVSPRRFQLFGGGNNGLRCLSLAKGWSGTAHDLNRLKYLDDVEAVAMDGPFVSNEYLRALQNRAQIKLVEIKHGKIQDDSLQLLRELPQLQCLSLYYTPVTDDAVATLVEMAPQSLILFGTRISDAGYQSLIAQLPNAFIDYRQGAFLGIGGSELPVPQSLGCEVTQVAANSAAARAGIMLGDTIVTYNGKPVRCFEEIRGMISQNAAGDKVQIELLRNSQKMNITIVLGEWE